MAGLWEKILSTLGFEFEEYGEEGMVRDERNAKLSGRGARDNVIALQQKRPMKLVVLRPLDFEHVKTITDHLKNNRTVIINLEDTSKDDAQRLLDFASGSIYALNGAIQKVGNNIFLLTPANVEVNADTLEQIYAHGLFPWSKSN